MQFTSKGAALAAVIVLSACASPAPQSASVAAAKAADLDCVLPSNCVNSTGTGGFAALSYQGSPAQAMALLQGTLKSFPEATVVDSDALTMQVIFTTPMGFRDQVDFRINPQDQRIDFRSRSLFGLFDWGKNRSRMQAFTMRFEQQARSR
jgi:uncharacterized protein (DUF1499 family)